MTSQLDLQGGGVKPPMHLVLVDGSGFIFRAFHGLPMMTRPDGVPVNAVFGFTNMLAKLLRDHVGTHLAVIFDAGRLTFRNEISPAYKAHRPDPPPELIPQFGLIREATEAFGVPSIELPGWEADDLIAAYAATASREGGQVTIVSSDKDLMQLIRPGITMLDPMKQKTIGPAEVMEKFGVPPDKVIEAQALIGDPVDNVPGVPGIGPKTAALLIAEFGDLEAILAAAPAMKPSKRRDVLIEFADQARMSRKLVILREDCPLPQPIAELGTRDPDGTKLATWLATQGFRSVISRLGLDGQAATPAPAQPSDADTSGADAPEAPTPHATAGAEAQAILTPAFDGYETVTSREALQAWIDAATAQGYVAVDTETDGLDTLRANLLGISLSTTPGRACYIPLRHQALDGALIPGQLDPLDAIAMLGPLLRDPAVLKIFHNAKFDVMVLENPDLGGAGNALIGPVDDTMLLSYSMEAGQHGHGLDELSRLHLGHTAISYDQVTGTGRARIPFAQVPLDRATHYAAEDADIALRLWLLLRPRLASQKSLALYEQMERRLVRVLATMERAGILVDEDELRRMSADFAVRMGEMERDIHKLAGREFNLGSA